MGAAHRNFYVDAFAKQGFEEVRQVERLWLEGDVEAARDLVPLELAEKSNLLGTEETIMARLRAYRDAGVDSLRVGLRGDDIDERLEELARLIDLVKRVDEEDTDEEGD